MAQSFPSPSSLIELAETELRRKKQRDLIRAEERRRQDLALREAFMGREVAPATITRVIRQVERAAAEGKREIMIYKFPAAYCSDKGRSINNFESDWPRTLQGYAKRAYDVFTSDLEPLGYKLRAEILNYVDGLPGDVGIWLVW